MITSTQTGCVSVPATHNLVVAENPGCSIEGADSICPDGDETLCGPEGDFTYSWEGPNGPYPDDRCITVENEGTYTLTVENENGCISICQHTLSLDEDVFATEPKNLWLCTSDTASFCVTPTGTGPMTYVWRHNGQVIDGESDNCCVIPSITAADEGVYTVTVSGKCSAVTLSATLVLADVVVEELRGLYLCEGQEARVCPEVSGMGPYSFEWTRNGVVVGNDSCLVLDAVTEEDEGMYCVTVQGACGEPVTRCSRMLVGTCEEYCGLTQGFWGNYGGKWNGMTTLELMSSLITG